MTPLEALDLIVHDHPGAQVSRTGDMLTITIPEEGGHREYLWWVLPVTDRLK